MVNDLPDLPRLYDTQHRVVCHDGSEVLEFNIASADHVIPQWLGGQTDRANIVAACRACNEDRGQLHNRSWFVLDATGFDGWLTRTRSKRSRRAANAASRKRLTVSLRPMLERALLAPTMTVKKMRLKRP